MACSEVHIVERSIPRVCGGTASVKTRSTLPILRSIPACAGEPRSLEVKLQWGARGLSPRVRGNQHNHEVLWAIRLLAVYPRVCGGTVPHTNPLCSMLQRSIPACAGEPLLDTGIGNIGRDWVYPRVCGGTSISLAIALPVLIRSIPACAGEPRP